LEPYRGKPAVRNLRGDNGDVGIIRSPVRAAKTLPAAEKDTEAFREATVDVPGQFKAVIRFERFQFRRGKMSRWFWTPYSAKRIE